MPQLWRNLLLVLAVFFRRFPKKLILLLILPLTFLLSLRFFTLSRLPVIPDLEDAAGSASSLLFGRNVVLLVCVISAPRKLEERNTARNTWMTLRDGSTSPKDSLTLFVVGGAGLTTAAKEELTIESERYGDLLILENLVDSYANLTRKVLWMYAWVHANLRFDYVLKMDDDSFARIDAIVDELKTNTDPHPRLYWGFFDGRARPFKKGKWSDKTWNLCDLYLPYALGGGYVISESLIEFVAKNARKLRLFFNEDVSMGTWLAPLDVRRVHDPRFDTEFKSRGCFTAYLVTHKQSLEQLRLKHKNLLWTGSICGGKEGEFRSRLSYDYNWTAPPSQCCHRGNSQLP